MEPGGMGVQGSKDMQRHTPRQERPEEEILRQVGARGGQTAAGRGERAGQRVVEPLRYLSPGGEDLTAETEAPETDAGPEQEWEARLAAKEAEWKAHSEAVRQQGLAEGKAELEGHRMELLRQCAEQWSRAVQDFAHARDSYFARVEREVVELALAIAARILQREAQVDPLLLAGAVRVALGQLQENTTVELRVPAAAHAIWSETLRLMPNLPVAPTVVADSEMKDGECVLTTDVGRVDLGARAQLKEIERGFFDLLSHRDPASGRDQSRARL